MKKVFCDFLSLLASSLLGLCLLISGFLIFINLYHYDYISYDSKINYSDYYNVSTFQKNIDSAFDKVQSVDINSVSVNNRTVANSVRNIIIDSINDLKKSKIYTSVGEQNVDFKTVYDYNVELLSNYSYNTLFYIPYSVELQVRDYSFAKSFDEVSSSFESTKSYIDLVSNYLRNRLLSNSDYIYTTDITRMTIFNELSDSLALVTNNYVRLSNEILKLADWYVSSFGGVR